MSTECKYNAGNTGLARYLGVSKGIVNQLVADGIPSFRVHTKFLYRKDQVDEFMERYSTVEKLANDDWAKKLTEGMRP
jgi:excisionase family DNA binding protein